MMRRKAHLSRFPRSAEPLRLLSYCLMPNHWHPLLCPQGDGQLRRFMQRLTMTHTRRWQETDQGVRCDIR